MGGKCSCKKLEPITTYDCSHHGGSWTYLRADVRCCACNRVHNAIQYNRKWKIINQDKYLNKDWDILHESIKVAHQSTIGALYYVYL
jgi:hypothetical protein